MDGVSVPEWAKTVVVVPVTIQSQHAIATGKQIKQIVLNLIDRYPKKKIIIFPESSMYCNTLCKNSDVIKMWSEEHVGNKVDIMIGTFNWEQDNLCNAFCHVSNGQIKAVFHKKQVLPLTEHIPFWLQYAPLQKAYFNGLSHISSSNNNRPMLFLAKDVLVSPYICSELFCNPYPDDVYNNIPIVAICNDTWFCYPKKHPYLQALMLRSAQLKAIIWQRPIVYCSFMHAKYISISGEMFELLSL